MEQFVTNLENANEVINSFIWIRMGLVLLISTGVIMTILTGFFQITRIKYWMKKTIGSVFGKKTRRIEDKGSVSQIQALCTALAATIGTGNIAGVSAAIVFGGPGAVFWMWVAAFFGMMTNFSENVLGIYYRKKNKDGEWSGGAMYYLKYGLGNIAGYEKIGSFLAGLFCLFAIFASFGTGNMGQVNKITANIKNAFFKNVNAPTLYGDIDMINLVIGVLLAVIGGVIIVGGIQRIALVAEKVVPFMALMYVVGALAIMCIHITSVPAMFVSIFKYAFGVKAVEGATAGITIKMVITQEGDICLRTSCKPYQRWR